MLKVESYRKGIVLSTGFNILNKGLVFCNSLIVAYYFGTQLKTDIYFFVFGIIVLFNGFAAGLNSTVLIPESMRIRNQENEHEAMRFLNFFLLLYFAVSLFVILIFAANPVLAFSGISHFAKGGLRANSATLYLALPLFMVMTLTTLLTDILSSYKFFTMPMIAGMINGIFSIAFVVAFHSVLGIRSLLAGLLVSYVINLLILFYLMKKRLNWRYFDGLPKVEKRIWKNVGFAQAGNITTMLYSYAPMYLFSGVSIGTITALNFAQQIAGIPTTLVTNQVSAVSGIKFNELYTRKNHGKMNEIYLTTTNFLQFILMPVSILLFLHAEEVVTILFKRGAFDSQSVLQSALFLKYLGLLLPMLAINTMGARMLMATHRIKESFWFQIVMNVTLVILIFVGVREFQIMGYLLAMLTIYFLSTLFQYYLFRSILPFVRYAGVLESFFKLLLLNACVGAVVYGAGFLLPGNVGPVVNVLFAGTLHVGLLLMLNSALKIDQELLNYTRTSLKVIRNGIRTVLYRVRP
ncbi:MAG TPA: lipid II flippase MurJ [Puia sp.]|nr:lipid II flippase MurJ [Puia sp.]